MFGLSQHDLDELPEDVRRAATNTPPMTPTRGARKTRKENT
jgi:hypothetical protein